MSTKSSKEEVVRNGKNTFEDGVYKALQTRGWVIPKTEEEVCLAESELKEHEVKLPSMLANPEAVWTRIKRTMRLVPGRSQDEPDTIEENLARAARERGNITPEIEKRMRQDREQAEKERC
ncbi:MAG: hypothetical protein ACKVRP_03125 [Bacteroidota bacterium]